VRLLSPSEASQVPTDHQRYAFNGNVYRVSHGDEVVLAVGGRYSVEAWARRQGMTGVTIGRYLGAPEPLPARK
jgi:hypothetical protein